MNPRNFTPATAPTPFIAGRKRYLLMAAAIFVAYLIYLAFGEPFLYSIDFDQKRIGFACFASFFFLGLLVWASDENDKDKVWKDFLNKRLETPDRPRRDSVQLADLLPETSQELRATLNGEMTGSYQINDTPGHQLNSRLSNIISMLATVGGYAIFMQGAKLVLHWLIGINRTAEIDVAIVFTIAGVISLIPYGAVLLFYRSQTLLNKTNYQRIDAESAKHRRYEFYKFHRQILLDHGFEELFDAQFNSAACTFFASSSRDVVAEVGTNAGKLYYAARTLTEDGHQFQTTSVEWNPRQRAIPTAIEFSFCDNITLEALLKKHAVLVTNSIRKSKIRLVALKDKAIDQLFLANRFRFKSRLNITRS